MKALQKLHNDVLSGKVAKNTFLTESKRHFPNLFTNLQPYEDVERILIKKGYIKENLTRDYVSQHEFHIGYEIEFEKCGCAEKAEQEVLKNLTKDRNYYVNMLAGKNAIEPQDASKLLIIIKESQNDSMKKDLFTKKSLKEMIKGEISKIKSKPTMKEEFSYNEDSLDTMDENIFEDHSGYINDPEYQFYAILNGKLISGYEFKEDAIDFKNEYIHKPIKVVSKKFLLNKGIDPNESKYWGQSSDLEEVRTNLFEQQGDPFEEEFKAPQQVSPELRKLGTDIKTAIQNNKEFKGLYDSAYSFAEQKDDTWKELMNTLAKKLYNYLASVKTYVDTVSKGDFSPIVKILTTSTSLKENLKPKDLKLTNLF